MGLTLPDNMLCGHGYQAAPISWKATVRDVVAISPSMRPSCLSMERLQAWGKSSGWKRKIGFHGQVKPLLLSMRLCQCEFHAGWRKGSFDRLPGGYLVRNAHLISRRCASDMCLLWLERCINAWRWLPDHIRDR